MHIGVGVLILAVTFAAFYSSSWFITLSLVSYIVMLSISRLFGGPPNHSQDENGGKSDGNFTYAYSTTQGRRPYMEDVHLEQIPLGPSLVDSGIFGVFDGHSGKKAAQYAKDNIPKLLSQMIPTLEPAEALRRTFLAVDNEFCNKAEDENLYDGSTAIVAFVWGNKLWVANAGDARCVLSSKGKAVAMSEDHKPNRDTEKRRIVAAGGRVIFFGCWRVEGVLATSRGFGDKELKKFVTAEPEVQTRSLQPGDDYLILASDGLWDVLSNQEAVDVLTKSSNIRAGAKALTDEALRRGSMDNISTLIVDIRGAFNSTASTSTIASSSASSSSHNPSSSYLFEREDSSSSLMSSFPLSSAKKNSMMSSSSTILPKIALNKQRATTAGGGSLHGGLNNAAAASSALSSSFSSNNSNSNNNNNNNNSNSNSSSAGYSSSSASSFAERKTSFGKNSFMNNTSTAGKGMGGFASHLSSNTPKSKSNGSFMPRV